MKYLMFFKEGDLERIFAVMILNNQVVLILVSISVDLRTSEHWCILIGPIHRILRSIEFWLEGWDHFEVRPETKIHGRNDDMCSRLFEIAVGLI